MSTEEDLTVIPERILEELNGIRNNPPSFTPYLTSKLEFYHDKLYFLENVPNMAINTVEGVKAPKELIEYLTNKEPLEGFKPSKILEHAAKKHAKDLGQKGRYEHKGSDDSMLMDRIKQFGEPEGHVVEVLQCGYRNPKQILASLLIDDGMPGRPHRKTLLNEGLHYIGVAIAPHSTFQYVTVIVLSQGQPREGKLKVPQRNTQIFENSPTRSKALRISRSNVSKVPNNVEAQLQTNVPPKECTCNPY